MFKKIPKSGAYLFHLCKWLVWSNTWSQMKMTMFMTLHPEHNRRVKVSPSPVHIHTWCVEVKYLDALIYIYIYIFLARCCSVDVNKCNIISDKHLTSVC